MQSKHDALISRCMLHDALVVILTSLDKLRDSDKLESWMTTIVRNVGYHYRKQHDTEQASFQQMTREREGETDTTLTPGYEQLQTLVALWHTLPLVDLVTRGCPKDK